MNAPTTLTKEHIKFIRTADRVSFHHSKSDGQHTILRATNKIGAELALTCAHQFRGFGHYSPQENAHGPIKAFGWVSSVQFSECFRTFADLLKPGDTIRADWMADTSGYTRMAKSDGDTDTPAFDGLYLDMLRLTIKRGSKEYTFHIETSVCPNNSARMFQF